MNDTPNNGYTAGDGNGSDPVNQPMDDIELQREQIAETRLEMTETIDEIQERLNPETLKEQAKDSVREATVGQFQEKLSNVKTSAGSAASTLAAQARTQGQTLASQARTQGQTLGTQARSQGRLLLSSSGTLVTVGTLLFILVQRRRAEQQAVQPEPSIRLPWRRTPEPVVDQSALTEALSNALSAVFARGAEQESGTSSSAQSTVQDLIQRGKQAIPGTTQDLIQRGKDRIRSTAAPAPALIPETSEPLQGVQGFVEENQAMLAAAVIALILTITGRLVDRRRMSA